jgi:hypothetical protein
MRAYSLSAKVDSSSPDAIEPVLRRLVTKGSVKKEKGVFMVEAELEGPSAKELNRSLLSSLRKAEKKTRLRAEWTFGNTTERYFDYVLKKTTKS